MRIGGSYIETADGKLIPWTPEAAKDAAKASAPKPETKPAAKLTFGGKKKEQ